MNCCELSKLFIPRSHISSILQVSLPADGSTGPCPGQVFDCSPGQSPQKVVDVSPVSEWLCNLGLAKYVKFFVQEEIDWDTLTWLTEEVFIILSK